MEQKTTALAHLKRMAARCKQEIAALAGLVVDAVENEFLQTTIPASAWRENTDTGATDFAYMADVDAEGMTAKDSVDAVLSPNSLTVAGQCGMASGAAVMDGKVRFYALEAPDADLAVQLRVIRGK